LSAGSKSAPLFCLSLCVIWLLASLPARSLPGGERARAFTYGTEGHVKVIIPCWWQTETSGYRGADTHC
ncbi:mCG146007, partial [Mus musculus]